MWNILPLRSLLKSWSRLISLSSLFLMVFSRASLFADPFIRVSYASDILWISCSSWKRGERHFNICYLLTHINSSIPNPHLLLLQRKEQIGHYAKYLLLCSEEGWSIACLEQHDGEYMTIFIFGWISPFFLTPKYKTTRIRVQWWQIDKKRREREKGEECAWLSSSWCLPTSETLSQSSPGTGNWINIPERTLMSPRCLHIHLPTGRDAKGKCREQRKCVFWRHTIHWDRNNTWHYMHLYGICDTENGLWKSTFKKQQNKGSCRFNLSLHNIR